jgi:hypothetical protein
MSDASNIEHAETIVAGQQAGAYSLPESVLAAHRARAALLEELDRVQRAGSPTAFAETLEELKTGLIEAARAGKEFPDYVRPIAEARLAEEARVDVLERVLGPAAATLGQALWTGVLRAAEGIVTDHLRPALEAVLEDARKPAATLAGKPVTPDVLDIVAAPLRKAYRELEQAAERYDAIRRARARLESMGYLPTDPEARAFLEFRRFDEIWPDFRKREHRSDAPWPADPAGRLAWAITSGAEPWMPTVVELDARWREYVEAFRARQAEQNAAASRRRVGLRV